jgi:RNA polymerase sigma factor (TIGR02999 family)
MSVRADSPDVTGLLASWGEGDASALDRLLPMVEKELHRLAHRCLRRERPDHTLQTGALVNEAYLRLVKQRRTHWHGRAHFFAIAARMMRRILVDHARKLAYAKRRGKKIELDEACIVGEERAAELVALDDALLVLARVDERKSRVVEMRYFGGLGVEEIASLLDIHPDTVTREWRRARLFLRRELERP